MGLFRNNYRKLAVENNEELAQLSGQSRGMLTGMFDYLNTFEVSLFELEVIKKDLIGLAKEADMEEAGLKDKIGMPQKQFCDSLVKDAMKPNHLEWLLPRLRNLMIVDFLLYAMGWTVEGTPELYGISLSLAAMNLLYLAWLYISTMVLQRKKAEHAMVGSKKQYVFGALIFMGNFLYVSSDGAVLEGGMPEFIVYGSGSVIFFALLALSAALFFGNNYYWDKCSEKYDWR